MSLSDIQHSLLSLATDGLLYSRFERDPTKVSQEMGLSDQDGAALSQLDIRAFSIFREVISGTRAARFEASLPTVHLHAGGAWGKYLDGFHREIKIPTSKKDQDLRQFVDYLICLDPQSAVSDSARLDAASLGLVSGYTLINQSELKWVSIKACQVTLSHSLEDLREGRVVLQKTHVLIVKNDEEGVDLYELDSVTLDVLDTLRAGGAL